MKKKLSIVLITVMMMSLFTGCLQKTNDISKATHKINIGICFSEFNDKFMSYLLDKMENYSKSLNDVEIQYVESKRDSKIQLSQVENFISQGVDVIVLVNPVNSGSSTLLTDKAKAAGVPLICMSNKMENMDDTVSYIGSDVKQSGILEMEYLAKKVNYKGNVAIMMGTMGEEPQRLRTEAFHEVIAKYPDMEIVAEQSAEWNRSKGMALMENWLESGKEINVVASNNDEMAIGALNAIEAAGKLGKITVGGVDGTPEALDYLKNGKLAVTVFQDASSQSKAVIDTAVKVSKGENVEKTIYLENQLVAPKDADKYIAKWKE